MIADGRISAFRRRLAQEDIPAFLVAGIPNVKYLTGFERTFDETANAVCLVTAEIARVYTDFRFEESASVEAEGTPWAVYSPIESMYEVLCDDLHALGIERLGMESSVPYGRFRFISEHFGGQVHVLDHWPELLRQTKEAAEIERIAAAAALADQAMDHALGMLSPGLVEREIALQIEVFMRRNGADGVAFSPIVASGPNSSKPHASATDRQLADGDFVTIDLGAKVGGYCSDMTRTVVMGSASARQREVYSAVLQANEAAIAAVRAGIVGFELDAIARDLLAKKGLAKHFGHGLGHGVGLEVHEIPHIGAKWRDAIPAGAVITVEPGAYIPEFGGVRIEDLVLVEESGRTVMTKTPKDLIEITTS